MTYSNRRTWLLLGALAAVAITACFGAGNTFGPEDDDLLHSGTLVVSTNTFGTSIDPDGYVAALDESRQQLIDVNGSVTFDSLRTGTYHITLGGVSANCTVAGSNPLAVMLLADSTMDAQFDVTCN